MRYSYVSIGLLYVRFDSSEVDWGFFGAPARMSWMGFPMPAMQTGRLAAGQNESRQSDEEKPQYPRSKSSSCCTHSLSGSCKATVR
jgi:hypothetical protein